LETVFRIRKFLGFPGRNRLSEVRVRILSSSSQNDKINIDFYSFVTSSWIFIFEEWCKCTFKKYPVVSKQIERNKIYFVDVLKVADEKSRIRSGIRIRIRTKMSWIRHTGWKYRYGTEKIGLVAEGNTDRSFQRLLKVAKLVCW
jgi:hypothetical protein